jgi:hypothetical protein
MLKISEYLKRLGKSINQNIKKNEWNLVLYKSGIYWYFKVISPSGKEWNMRNMTAFLDERAAKSAALLKPSSEKAKKIWIISAVFDSDIGKNGDYRIVKKYWEKV